MSNAVRISLIVPGTGTDLGKIVRPIDLQDVGYDHYQVIFVADGSATARRRLDDLARHRPNVAVTSATDLQPGSWWRHAVGLADGDYVLALGPRDRLQPWAVRTLAGTAAATGADVVLGRSVGDSPAGFLPDALDSAWDPGNPLAACALLAPVALIRRELFASSWDGAADWRTARARLLTSNASVHIVADPAVSVGPGPAAGESLPNAWQHAQAAAAELPAGSVREAYLAAHLGALLGGTPPAELTSAARDAVTAICDQAASTDPAGLPPALRELLTSRSAARWTTVGLRAGELSARWQHGSLQLDTSVEVVTDDQHLTGLEQISLQALVRHQATDASFRLPAEVSGDATSGYTVSLRIDPATAAAGQPLFDGSWAVSLRLAGSGCAVPATVDLPYAPAGAAIVDGVQIASFADDGQLRLEVGAAKHGIFGSYQPADAAVSETAAGSLLTINLPDLSSRGEARLPGHLYLGKFGLPAVLRTSAERAWIECYVSGLAGLSNLAARFGDAARQSLGLRLRIGPVGDISVERRPQPNAEKTAKPAGQAAPERPTTAKPTKPTKPTKSTKPTKPSGAQSAPAATGSDEVIKSLLGPAFRQLPAPARKRIRRVYRALRDQ